MCCVGGSSYGSLQLMSNLGVFLEWTNQQRRAVHKIFICTSQPGTTTPLAVPIYTAAKSIQLPTIGTGTTDAAVVFCSLVGGFNFHLIGALFVAFACFVCLKKEKPDANMEDLVKEADTIVAAEIAERQKKREEEAAATSTDGKLETTKEEGEEEVTSA